MTQLPSNHLGPNSRAPNTQRANPVGFALIVGSYISAFVRLVYWTVAGALACATGLLAIRVIIWSFRGVTTAIGV